MQGESHIVSYLRDGCSMKCEDNSVQYGLCMGISQLPKATLHVYIVYTLEKKTFHHCVHYHGHSTAKTAYWGITRGSSDSEKKNESENLSNK